MVAAANGTINKPLAFWNSLRVCATPLLLISAEPTDFTFTAAVVPTDRECWPGRTRTRNRPEKDSVSVTWLQGAQKNM
ncbi:hypothetical protein SARC_16953 [Sphaeroforma arctica JP610]|uniref:Uncharacterized protein n=1 Tax=Sphaeroforma arctica JP610 TaxID=667725 RepID=A0A0L0F2W8_9EUKA|nr:hypothetical protein SARC_16953 [Sphaeroforma arctica JP610]KNC70518.1 hypothetical protein SARC_16953 [Sphaeroforma arctica JP610]|eukprot:XP_014144420.1 hypothetical protein SARC_16953 [Sphaeroforma arctica JP610]